MSYGLYIENREPRGLADQLRAWSLVLPSPAAFTHLSAAELRGWWLPQRIPHPVFAALRESDPCVLDLVLMGDSALRLGHCTIDQLVKTASQRRRGAPMLRRVVADSMFGRLGRARALRHWQAAR